MLPEMIGIFSDQVVEADVIVHIVDASSSSREKQESAVVHVLSEMGVVDKPRITLWNKLDLLPEEERVCVWKIVLLPPPPSYTVLFRVVSFGPPPGPSCFVR